MNSSRQGHQKQRWTLLDLLPRKADACCLPVQPFSVNLVYNCAARMVKRAKSIASKAVASRDARCTPPAYMAWRARAGAPRLEVSAVSGRLAWAPVACDSRPLTDAAGSPSAQLPAGLTSAER